MKGRMWRRLSAGLITLGLSAASGSLLAQELEFPDAPLFLTEGVRPNLIMAVDNSGSMDNEVLFPTNDGAAWWMISGQSSGSCTSSISGSFAGCGSNGSSDVPAAGTLNFNRAGGSSGTWKKYTYLFPNGCCGNGRRIAGDGSNDHFAIPPLPAFAWARSPAINKAYFDPATEYPPWADSGSYVFGDASPTAAQFDPVLGSNALNLTRDVAGTGSVDPATACTASGTSVGDNWYFKLYRGMTVPAGTCYRKTSGGWTLAASAINVGASGAAIADADRVAIRYFPATFWLPVGQTPPASFGYIGPTTVTGLAPDGAVLIRYEIKPANFVSTAKYDAAIQNFANWFSYYRRRHQALRAGLGLSFEDITRFNVGGFPINNRNTVTMRDLTVPSEKQELYKDFYEDWLGSGGTPNLESVEHIINQFKRSSNNPVQYACQQNFGMLFTDGFSNSASTSAGSADNDKGAPYADDESGTMADATMKAYTQKLVTGFADGKVPTPSGCNAETPDPWLDCNNNLHMNFYAVTLGARGFKYDPEVHSGVTWPYENKASIDANFWPNFPIPARNPGSVDDLWHATINGRGELLNAATPDEITDKLTAVLRSIEDKTASAASVALNSSFLDTESALYQAEFDSATWSGALLAVPIADGSGGGCGGEAGDLCSDIWDAADRLDNHLSDVNSRVVLTYNDASGEGVPFEWSELSAAQQAALNTHPDSLANDGHGALRLAYLRGDRSQEAESASPRFRMRGSRLGDIINSDPFYVGMPPYAYEFSGYTAHRAAYAERDPIVYVGANDGMLHGFDAETGDEVLAYVPSKAYGTSSRPGLSRLTDPNYGHAWFVDGSPTVGDVELGGGWESVLVGTMRQGGQGVFALKVTDPTEFTAGEAADIVMWEFTDADDADLGYTFSQPSIVKLADGKWVAIVGSGYNNTEADGHASATGRAAVFMLNIEGPGADGVWNLGTDYVKLVVTGGSPSNPNGMATPAAVDLDGDDIVEFLYAGDLRGNLWMFDVISNSRASWSVGYGGAPVFTAKDDGGNTQPITGRPEVGLNLLSTSAPYDLSVYFGTGRYIDVDDNSTSGQPTQTFYGIFDDPLSAGSAPQPTRAQLLEQSVIYEAGGVRVTSDNIIDSSHKGWYLDLPTSGERQVSTPILRSGRIIFTTLIPSTDVCEAGGSGWLMEMSAIGGARLDEPTLDINDDGVINEEDYVTVVIDGEEVKVPASGEMSDVGIIPRPTILVIDDEREVKYAGGTDGGIETFYETAAGRRGRITWREIRP